MHKLISLNIASFLTLLLIGAKASVAADFKIVDVAVGWAKPPYIDQDNNSGFEVELVENIMAPLGYRINLIYVPYGRSQRMVQNGEVDMMLTAHDRLMLDPIMLSDKYIVYENVAVSLKRNNLKIEKIEDLKRYSLVAFQNASLVLGKRFKHTSQNSKNYIELPEQENQVEMLFKGKTQVIVLDINIFTHFQQALSDIREQEAYTVHHIFPENQYKVAFKDPDLKLEFNRSLAQFIQTDAYHALRKKYSLAPQNLD